MFIDPKKATIAPSADVPLPRERAVIWVLWLTYGAFYFCRTNLSAAAKDMTLPLEKGGLDLSKEQVGYILASLKIAYGLGQGLNGQLAERFSPRVLLALGMLGSAALNVLFGLGTGFYFLLFVWACNGYAQSLGWTPCMRVVANWVPVFRRGRAIGLIGTGYQVTLGLTFLVATWAVQWQGWRAALFVPAGLLTLTAIFMLLVLDESPQDHSSANQAADHPRAYPASRPGSFFDNIILTLQNPALWLLGLSLGLLNACRFGYLDWGLTHLQEVQKSPIGESGVKYALLPVGAVAGVYLAGWATDRFFGGRRAPVICLLLLVLAGLTPLYHTAAREGGSWVIPLLMVIGFCIYGPQVLLVGTAPADLARRGTSAAAAGFVNFLGYMGAAAGDVVTGRVLDKETWGWQVAIYVWAGWALVAALAAALLWNATARADR
ncbi:MAG TPA: MFS transporter [Gemmataceae bacterium]|nr:MFS transporter [Gemmataceae bacterium]